MDNNELYKENINDAVDENKKNWKRRIIRRVIVGVFLIILLMVVDLVLTKQQYRNIIEELKEINDGKMHNIAEMYNVVNKISKYKVNVDEFYENEVIKEIENLEGNWVVSSVKCNGETSNLGEKENRWFSDGVMNEPDAWGNKTNSYDIYYNNGIIYLGAQQSDDKYMKIIDYDGCTDNTLIIEEVYSIEDVGEDGKYLWQYNIVKE